MVDTLIACLGFSGVSKKSGRTNPPNENPAVNPEVL